MYSNIEALEKHIKNEVGQSSDFFSRILLFQNKKILYCFFESVSSDDKISNFFMKGITSEIRFHDDSFMDDLGNYIKNTIINSKLTLVESFQDIYYYLACGFTCIFVEGYSKIIAIETKAILDRSVSESSSEAIIRGPKDSFTENYMVNLGLIRKRIRDKSLRMDELKLGRRTKSKIAIGYIKEIADLNHVKKIKTQLKKIDIDGIIDSSYIAEFFSPTQHSSFPKLISTERPDLVCQSLLNGKICIFVENTPYVLILPAVLSDFLHSPEDNYQKPSNVSFTRMLRMLAFFITLLTPAIYIAVTTFNQEMIPDRLLISLAIQRESVPFPTAFEVLLLMITFEMLRESDIRIPKITGTAISVVGALVLGDAAVNAGIISPIVVIIIAITSICGLLFTDVDFVNSLRFWRIFFIFCAAIMGIIGIVAGGIIFITKLSSLECMGTPYLAPLSPFNLNDNKNAIIRIPRNKLFKRSIFFGKKNKTRLEVKKNEN